MKVLVIRFSSIGDIVLTTPVLRVLKNAGATVHYLTKRTYESIVASNPRVDRCFVIDEKVKEVLPALKAEQYDYVIDLHHNLRSRQVKSGLSATAFSVNKINWEKWLMVNLKMDRLPSVHIVDRYLETLQPLGLEKDGDGLEFYIPEEDEVEVAHLLTHNVLAAQQEIPRYVAFAIGAAHYTKRIPEDKVIAICQGIQMPVLLLGGPAEAEVGDRIAGQAGGQVINTCGLFNLNQSASIIRQAYRVITPDTGMMHIAAAFQKKIISVWGNTIPAFGMYPYDPQGLGLNMTIEVKELPCRPCSKIGFEKCPKGHFNCMQQIEEAAIWGAL
ncbi:MAG TPA: glycosyltransferase family 9 protein [Saprospiraceae bacterium]|nr:glycosyltransferase family 9 protein [Saprospiraceae bacterium]HMQ84274.1 glycosyltransferase family 9 protein [Saprospiraceae bacterium]